MSNKVDKPKVDNNIDSIISNWNNTDYTVFDHSNYKGELLIHNHKFKYAFYVTIGEADSLRLIEEVGLIHIDKDLFPSHLGIGDYATREKLISNLRHLNKKIQTRTDKVANYSRQIEILTKGVSYLNELIKDYGK
jgi:hypothetical protein